MIMKKLFALLLATLMVLSLAACGNGDTTSENTKKEEIADNSQSKQKESVLEKLVNSYWEVEEIGQYKTGNRKVLLSEKNDDGVEIKRVCKTRKEGFVKPETLVLYNPEKNTISVISVDAGVYDDYSLEDETVIEFNQDNKPVKSVRQRKYFTETKTYNYDTNGRIIEISEEEISKDDDYTNKINYTFEYLENGKILKTDYNIAPTAISCEYEFDDNGFVIRRTTDYGDGDLVEYFYENNEDGNMVKMYTKDSSGQIQVLKEYTYDEEGYVINIY